MAQSVTFYATDSLLEAFCGMCSCVLLLPLCSSMLTLTSSNKGPSVRDLLLLIEMIELAHMSTDLSQLSLTTVSSDSYIQATERFQ